MNPRRKLVTLSLTVPSRTTTRAQWKEIHRWLRMVSNIASAKLTESGLSAGLPSLDPNLYRLQPTTEEAMTPG